MNHEIAHGIFNISSLQADLSNNSFSGTMPMNLCDNSSKLNVLRLNLNSLSGVFPSNFYKCKSLEILSLSDNEFNGSIPKEIGGLTMLEELYLGWNNHLRGQIFPNLLQCRSLLFLSLWDNEFTGAIPKEVGNLTQLIILDSALNKMTGTTLIDKFEIVDTANLGVKVAVIEGPMFREKLDALESEKWFVDSGDGGCIIKWKTRHHLKPGHTHVPQEESKSLNELSITFLTATETYLVAHPHVST
ncbi:hypothetical protein F511_05932 [Dorcoceras hygrometricum]|uniref:Bet v I/Major latex protein domain-containing protein n=1 Tax=Dorcoceras hygrometricum TaxID=472368 RepID=A0A2Z7DHY5_9LAMI|nr:hypothetical protein F511_05932 [Dorcoceras hygrometricum]